MSQPIPEAELAEYMHEEVEEYCLQWQGEGMNIPYLHEEIDNPKKRTDLYDEFWEYIQDTL